LHDQRHPIAGPFLDNAEAGVVIIGQDATRQETGERKEEAMFHSLGRRLRSRWRKDRVPHAVQQFFVGGNNRGERSA